MAKQKLYWVGPGVFGGGEDAVKIGEEMPTNLTSEHLDALKAQGLVSAEKTVTERQLSELEQLQKKVAELEKGGGKALNNQLKDAAERIKVLEAEKLALETEIADLTDPENGKSDTGADGKLDPGTGDKSDPKKDK